MTRAGRLLVMAAAGALLPLAQAQFCNSEDPLGGGLVIPAFGHGDAMATLGNGTQVPFCIVNQSDPGKGYLYDCKRPDTDSQPAMAVAYFAMLLYLFLGVAIISDVFMSSIDVIASSTKVIQVNDPKTGEFKEVEVVTWNATVANLTLMALGTSAPEILLSVIEILTGDFYSGDLGPGTIVGSAAYNLLCITAVCMAVLPKANLATGETGLRRVDEYEVFLVTTGFSFLAYGWLLLILTVISPNVVEWWEALITFLLYPAVILAGYYTDKKTVDEVVDEDEGQSYTRLSDYSGEDIQRLLQDDQVKGLSLDEQAQLAQLHHFEKTRKSRLVYRVAAIREYLSGRRSPLPNLEAAHKLEARVHRQQQQHADQIQALPPHALTVHRSPAAYPDLGRAATGPDRMRPNGHSLDDSSPDGYPQHPHAYRHARPEQQHASQDEAEMLGEPRVGFVADLTTVFEDEGEVHAVVRRTGPLYSTLTVDYTLEGGTATAGVDFAAPKYMVPTGPTGGAVEMQRLRHEGDEHKEQENDQGGNPAVYMGLNLVMMLAMSLDRTAAASAKAAAAMVGMGAMAAYNQWENIKSLNPFGGKARAKPDPHALANMAEMSEISGRLTFQPFETEKTIVVPIIDDDIIENDETFFIQLLRPRLSVRGEQQDVDMGVDRMTVMILDDDAGGAGLVEMATDPVTGVAEYTVSEDAGVARIKVVRKQGFRGRISVDYIAREGSAIEGKDFVATEGTLTMESGQASAFIEVPIMDDEKFEKRDWFAVVLSNAQGCELGKVISARVSIVDDDGMGALSRKIAAHINLNLDRWNVYAGSWGGQFREALEMPPREAGCGAKVMHFVSLPWKLTFSLVPPARLCGGWLGYIGSFIMIAGLTALVADVATHLGCCLGIDSAVTAVTFVAIGTSLPDTFASKIVAINDKTADNSIGKVTGSNSVNVFLGLGLPWLVASIYWTIQGATPEWKARVGEDIARDYPNGGFVVEAGSLSFSIGVFFICCVVWFLLITWRRRSYGAELGGPGSTPIAIGLVLMWVGYIALSILKVEGIV